jgi:hypothetical protein
MFKMNWEKEVGRSAVFGGGEVENILGRRRLQRKEERRNSEQKHLVN